MADKYAVAAGGNWSAAGTWALTDGGAGGAGAPSASENAFFSNQSGNVVVDSAATCLDIDMTKGTGYAGTLSGSAALAVAGNVKWNGAATITYAGTLTASGATKTWTSNGKSTTGNITITGSYTQADAFVCNGGVTFTQNAASSSWTTAGFGFTTGAAQFSSASTRTTNMGGGTTWTQVNANGTVDFTNTTGLTFTAPAVLSWTGGSGTINFFGGGLSWNVVQTTGVTGTFNITGANSYTAFSLVGGAGKLGTVSLAANQTVSGAFKYLGNSAINRLLILSSVLGTPRTITAGSIDATSNFCDFMDIVGAGAAAPFATGASLGDCGGNSGITFTTAATQTATGTASFTWSTHGWTSRVPLPQDDVVISNAFVAGRTVTADMPRLGKSLTFTCTGNPAMTPSLAVSIFGSLTLVAGMTWTSNQQVSLSGRGSHMITSAGVTINGQPVFNGPAAAWSQQDALSVNSTGGAIGMNLAVGNGLGTYTTNGFAVTISAASTIGFRATSGTLNMGASIWLFPALGGWQVVGGFGGTINAGTSTIKYTDASATLKLFDGGGKTYNNVWFNNAGSGTFDITGSNTFNQFKVDAGRSVRFTAGTTQTAADFQFGDGCTIGSITAAGHTLAKSGGGRVVARNASISRSAATPATIFYAPGGTNGGNNSGWTFAEPFNVAWSRNANVLIGSGAQA